MPTTYEKPMKSSLFGSGNVFSHSKIDIGNYIEGDYNQNTNIYTDDTRYDVTNIPCPYPGLNPYTDENAQYFAGRDNLIEECIKRLTPAGHEQILFCVYGASGSGKSSFVRAGLVPSLKQYYQKKRIVVHDFYVTPRKSPRTELIQSLQPIYGNFDDATTIQVCFDRIINNSSKDIINILVIDQGEELFTQSDDQECQEMLSILTNLPTFNQLRTFIIMTFRADFLANLYAHQTIYEQVIKKGLDLRAMTEEEIQQAILKPLEGSNKLFELLLVEELAQVTAQQPSFLPLLQMTLLDIWQTGKLWLKTKRLLSDSLVNHANKSLNQVSREFNINEKEIIELLAELVDIHDDPRLDARRYRNMVDLETLIPNASKILDSLALEQYRLVVIGSGEETIIDKPQKIVTLVHEILLQCWERLRNAIDEKREIAVQFKQFERSFNDWIVHDKNESELLSQGKIDLFKLLRNQSSNLFKENHNEYLNQSEHFLQEKEKIWKRWRKIAFAIISILALIYPSIVIYRWYLKRQATMINEQVFIPNGILKQDTTINQIFIPISGFRMDKFEVSNRQYDLCIRANGCDELQNPALFQQNIEQHPDFPVVNITAFEAIKYCQWLGGSLPTDAEWEYAVRGLENRKYPWGNILTMPLINYVNLNLTQHPSPTLKVVTSYPIGTSPDGIFNLFGNVSEWVATPIQGKSISPTLRWNGSFEYVPSLLLTRGGSFTDATEEQMFLTVAFAPTETRRDVGFRCRYNQ